MKIGPYKILGPVGRGGMGMVLRAQRPDGGEVAIKVLNALDAPKRARFAREVRLLDALGEAEGFVPLLDSGESPQGPYLVMPFLAGGTLRDRMEAGKLPVQAVVTLGRALARAIGGAHARGVVHRDLKPENILFGAPAPSLERPLVADLGLAKHFRHDLAGASQSQALSAQGELRGSIGYMAPEQLRDSASAGPQADVFALGAILHECLGGEPAFEGDDAIEILGRIDSGQFAPLRARRPDAPAPVVAAIEKALARDPAARFRDGLAFAAALEAAPSAEKGRRPVALALSLLLVALSVSGGLLYAMRGAPPPPPPTPDGSALAVVESPAVSSAANAEARKHAERALKLYGAGDNDGAVAAATLAVELDPRLAMAWLVRGTIRLGRDDQRGAIADLERSVAIDPSLALAWGNLASAYHDLQDYDHAFTAANKAIEGGDPLPLSYVVRGEVQKRRGDLDGALESFTRAVERDPTCTPALLGRGFARLAKDMPLAARADLEKFLSLVPKDPSAGAATEGIAEAEALLDAEQSLEAGDWERAIVAAAKVLDRDPRSAPGHSARGVARLRLGDLEGALADLEKATRLDPRSAGAWTNLGVLQIAKNDLPAALRAFGKAIAADPHYAPAFSNRALARFRDGDTKGAIEDATWAIDEDAKDAQAWVTRGLARERAGLRSAALVDLERALQLLPPGGAEAARVREAIARVR